jgi:hypothetical protein
MKASMRDRPPESQRSRAAADRGGPDRFWPLIALFATILATAGWTTVIVMSLNDRDPVTAAASASLSSESSPVASVPEATPEPPSHADPELEGLLPSAWDGSPLAKESVTGDEVLLDDDWSGVFRTYLESLNKSPADLHFAQATESTGTVPMTILAFRIEEATGEKMLETVIGAWKAEYPDLESTVLELGGKSVTRGVFSEGDINSYWYEHDGVVYDVETADEALAAAILETLP